MIKAQNNSQIYNQSTMVLDSLIKNNSRLELDRNTNAINIFSITEIDTLGKKMNFDFDYLNFKSNSNNHFSSISYDATKILSSILDKII